MIKRESRLTISDPVSAGAEFILGVRGEHDYEARKRPFTVFLSGYGIDAFRNLSVDDLVGIRDWIDRALADREVAA